MCREDTDYKKDKIRYRFWVSPLQMRELLQNKKLIVTDALYHYIHTVIRAKCGAVLECLTNTGEVAKVEIVEIQKKAVHIILHSYYCKEPEGYTIILAIGASKNLRRSFILEKCVELSITSIWVWQGEHSQGSVSIKDSWQEILQTSATQCINPYIPTIEQFSSLEQVVEQSANRGAKTLFFYEDNTQTQPFTLQDMEARIHPLVIIIGCEGGFSHREVAFLQKNTIPAYSLSNTILRYETATILACGIAVMANNTNILRHG